MNAFEELCILASDENWCWNIYCTTCGHLHFRYSFSQIANGKSPANADWLIHSKTTDYTRTLGSLPRQFTANQKQKIIEICKDADLSRIANECKFPDWLGYLGLVLHHLSGNPEDDRKLSLSWASQLKNLVPASSRSYTNLESICSTNSKLLSLADLENCEADIQRPN
jgi:hypothetical protein